VIQLNAFRHRRWCVVAVLAAVCVLGAPQTAEASVRLSALSSPVAETVCPPATPMRVVPITDGAASDELPETPICRSSVESQSLIINNSDVVWELRDHVTEGAGRDPGARMFRTYAVPLISLSPHGQFLVPGESVLVEHKWGRVLRLDMHAQLTALWRSQQTVSKGAESVLGAPLPFETVIMVKSAIAACAVATMDAAGGVADTDVDGVFWIAVMNASASAAACERAWNDARQIVDLPALPDFRAAAR
jgi:hypothetical protein